STTTKLRTDRFSLRQTAGNLILQTYDLAQRLRQVGITVVGGFHSPMERECLTILLRGTQPIIVCPARSITGMRMRAEYKQPLEKGRLLFLSPFIEEQRRATVQTASYRNRFVAALADHIFVAYASAGSKIEQFCREVLAWQKPLYTLEGDANIKLMALGAKPISPDNLFYFIHILSTVINSDFE
ncbi:MAG: hypothetical protein QME81_20690, partial [bacterium]|nr:hypothetical protein [bacterium]